MCESKIEVSECKSVRQWESPVIYILIIYMYMYTYIYQSTGQLSQFMCMNLWESSDIAWVWDNEKAQYCIYKLYTYIYMWVYEKARWVHVCEFTRELNASNMSSVPSNKIVMISLNLSIAPNIHMFKFLHLYICIYAHTNTHTHINTHTHNIQVGYTGVPTFW